MQASTARQNMKPDPNLRVLVVEDEHKVASALKEGLEGEGYDVVVEHTGEAALVRLKTDPFDIILLDLLLPGRDGLQVLRTLREQGFETPVLVLTARDTLEDRVTGLDSGADDYLVKPFAFAEVVARMRALLRRGRASGATRLGVADLEMDLVDAESDARRDGRWISRCASSSCSNTCCATRVRSCRAARSRATCGTKRPARRRSTTSSTCTSRGSAGRSTRTAPSS